MTPRRALLVGLTATAVLGTGFAWGSSSYARPRPAATTAAVTPAPGRVLAGNCFQCHGTDGSGGPFEGIAGESARELYGELKEQQSEGGIMGVHAQSYSDAQLRLIADYFSQVSGGKEED